MKKIILITVILLLVIGGFFYLANNGSSEISPEPGELPGEEPKEEPIEERPGENNFIQCLAEQGLVIYGTPYCPACTSLRNDLSQYGPIDLIYVDCSQEQERCTREMQTQYVPEIQIKGQLYDGSRSAESLAEELGCKL